MLTPDELRELADAVRADPFFSPTARAAALAALERLRRWCQGTPDRTALGAGIGTRSEAPAAHADPPPHRGVRRALP
jgi:hypothetical protein